MRSVVLLLIVPGLAWGQTSATWKFKPGDSFAYQRIAKDEQSAIVNKGQSVKQDVRSTWVYRFEAKKVAGDAATLGVTIEQAQVQHLAGPGSIDNKILERMKGAELVLVVNAQGEVKSMEGYDALVDQASEKRADLAKTIRQLWPETLVRREFQEIFAVTPPTPVVEGNRWQQKSTMPTPPLGQFATTLTAVSLGLDRAGHHRFTGALTGTYERPEHPAEMFRVAGGQLTLHNGTWTCSFDGDRGRLMNQTLSFELRGDLTIELQGAPTPMEMTIRREVKTKLLPPE